MLETGHKYARFETRLVAAILDTIVLASCFLLIFAAAVFVLLITSDFGEGDPPDLAFWAAFALIAGYFVAFVPLYFIAFWAWRGQTMGQMAVHIQVIARNGGSDIGLGSSVLRLIGCIFSTALLFIGFLMVLWDSEKRGLHDHIANTIVIEIP
jgi:uncharacterized RDD family membrane protein YckC